jgi:hypothetical protein
LATRMEVKGFNGLTAGRAQIELGRDDPRRWPNGEHRLKDYFTQRRLVAEQAVRIGSRIKLRRGDLAAGRAMRIGSRIKLRRGDLGAGRAMRIGSRIKLRRGDLAAGRVMRIGSRIKLRRGDLAAGRAVRIGSRIKLRRGDLAAGRARIGCASEASTNPWRLEGIGENPLASKE